MYRRQPRPSAASSQFGRRRFLARMGSAGSAAGVLWMGGCGYYRPARGEAYAPWNFPDPDLPPRLHIVHAGLLAANPHNTQPWWFHLPDDRPDTIELWADMQRDIGAVDPFFREMNIGFGCALENMVVGGLGIGRGCTITLDPSLDEPDLVARIEVTDVPSAAEDLYEAISTRRTNRHPYADFSLDPRISEALEGDVEAFGDVSMRLLTSAADKKRFGDATVAATRAFIADREMLEDSDVWFRHTKAEIDEHRDGPTLDANVTSAAVAFFAKTGARLSPERSAEFWLRSTERVHTGPCSGYVVLGTTEPSGRQSTIAVGRAYQRLALRLESYGLAVHPISQLLEMRDRELQLGSEPSFGRRLGELAPVDAHAQHAFRLGYAWRSAHPSPRRPLSWVVMGSEV